VNDVETTNVLLSVNNHTCSAHVTSTGDNDDVASVELDELGDLVLVEIELDGVVNLDGWIRVTDGSAVVSDNVRYAPGTNGHLPDLEELVGSLLGGDTMDGESALDIVQQTEMLIRLFDRDHIHKSSGVSGVCPDLTIDFDESLVDDRDDFTTSQGILQTVTEEDGEGKGFS